MKKIHLALFFHQQVFLSFSFFVLFSVIETLLWRRHNGNRGSFAACSHKKAVGCGFFMVAPGGCFLHDEWQAWNVNDGKGRQQQHEEEK